MKNIKFRGIKTNSAVKFRGSNSAEKTQIPRLGSKFCGPRKTVGPTDQGNKTLNYAAVPTLQVPVPSLDKARGLCQLSFLRDSVLKQKPTKKTQKKFRKLKYAVCKSRILNECADIVEL